MLGLIPKHGVSTSAWKSPLQLKEWFCVVDLNLEKMKLIYDADTLIIHDTACAYIFISTAFYTL